MFKFILKRILYGFLVLFGVITVVFMLFNVMPGDPARLKMGQRSDEKSLKVIRQDLNLDLPLHKQYFMFLNDLSFISIHDVNKQDSTTSRIYLNPAKYGSPYKLFKVGKNRMLVMKSPYLRRSYRNQRPVWDIIEQTLPATFVLAITSIIFASVIGILFGIISALYKNSFWDRLVAVISTLGMAGPSFFFALIIAWLFGYLWRDYTGLKNIGSLYTMNVHTGQEELTLKNLILPAFTLGIRPLALIIQLTRSSMLEVLSFDYIRTARAKGLSQLKVVVKHALKNALNPVITAISGWFAGLMAGAVFVEDVFDWKGIGKEVVDALFWHDLPVVMGCTLIFSTCFVVINIIVDIVYAILDPRVRLQ
ncbi:MAG: ABC transporter permease [Bacteroidetes bacterium]|nr:ABC transporter permease [Bacteroidota bacterium]